MLITDAVTYRIVPTVKPAISRSQGIGLVCLTLCALLALAMPAVEPNKPAAWVFALVFGIYPLAIVWYGVRSAYREAWELHCYRTREAYRKHRSQVIFDNNRI